MARSYWATAISRPALAISRLAWLAPPEKRVKGACGMKVQPQVPALNNWLSSLLEEPTEAVSEIRGKNAALATPICALAAINRCSAATMSGRSSRTWEGKPTGTSFRI